jgi:hypothetical protein
MTDIRMLREQLDQIGNEAADLRVDVGRARAHGRRLLRLRRAGAATGSAAMIGVVLVAVTIMGRAAPPSRPASGAPPGPATAPAPLGHLVATGSFGWLPAGFAADSFVADSQGQSYFEVDATTGSGNAPVITLTDYGRGPQPALPDLPGGVPASTIPTAPVNGRVAYWITEPSIGPTAQLNFELRWEYGPHRWADLQASGLRATSVADLRSTAYRIARTATLGERVPLRMPLGVTGVPAGLQARRSVLNTGAEASALMYFVGSDLAPSDSIQFSVSRAGVTRPGVTANTVVDKHPAYDSQLAGRAGDAILLVFGVHGLDVEIDAGEKALGALPSSHDLIWLFDHMTVVASSRGTS